MITEPDYEYATNAAYIELSYYNGCFPQIDILELLSEAGDIALKSYSQAARFLKCSHNDFTYKIAQSEYGYSVTDWKRGYHIIYFNNFKDDRTVRFTLAHELGHIRLHHIEDNDISDREANCFARNLLCPIQLVKEFGLSSVKEYEECFNISEPCAKAAFAHSVSDFHYITPKNYQVVGDKIYSYMTGYSLAELYGY